MSFDKHIENSDNKLIELFKNRTFTSLSKISFKNESVSHDVLLSLKNMTFDDALVRKKQMLNRKYKTAVAPLHVYLNSHQLNDLKKNNYQVYTDLLKPIEIHLPVVYLNSPLETRLARFKIYL